MDSFPQTPDSREFLHCKQTERVCYTSKPSRDCGSTREFASLGELIYLINYTGLRTGPRAWLSASFVKKLNVFCLPFQKSRKGPITMVD